MVGMGRFSSRRFTINSQLSTRNINVLICDPISPKGIALFESRPEFKVTVLEKPLKEAELLPIVKDVEAMVVRSETKVTRNVIEAASKLRVVGRAGGGIEM